MNSYEIFTAEEINLICIYDIRSRQKLLAEIKQSMQFVYDPEMIEIMVNVVKKLDTLSDIEFDKMEFLEFSQMP